MKSKEKDPPSSPQSGKIGYILAWLMGVPVSVLVVIFILRGCN